MAGLSVSHPVHMIKNRSKQELIRTKISPRTSTCVSCRSGLKTESSTKERGGGGGGKEEAKKKKQFLVEVGEILKEGLSPKRKGDWKDLVLMSLSFAVYVYISQKIVCAYCAWISILKHS